LKPKPKRTSWSFAWATSTDWAGKSVPVHSGTFIWEQTFPLWKKVSYGLACLGILFVPFSEDIFSFQCLGKVTTKRCFQGHWIGGLFDIFDASILSFSVM
jgi:hypothetical protein